MSSLACAHSNHRGLTSSANPLRHRHIFTGKMNIRFDGKRALVTGAGKGIGRDIAVALHKCGAKTVAISRTQADLDSLKAENPGIQAVTLDVSDWNSARAAISCLGHFDLLVNNAGMADQGVLFLDYAKEQLDTLFDTNFHSAFNISQVVAKGMVESGKGGAIVNVSSVLGSVSIMGAVGYSATKAAMDSLTRCMALELGPNKIRVNSVQPTLTNTTMAKNVPEENRQSVFNRQSIQRIAEAEEVTSAVLFLLSDKASMITGALLPVDGGYLAN